MDLTKTDGTNRISQPVFLMAVGRKSDGCWADFPGLRIKTVQKELPARPPPSAEDGGRRPSSQPWPSSSSAASSPPQTSAARRSNRRRRHWASTEAPPCTGNWKSFWTYTTARTTAARCACPVHAAARAAASRAAARAGPRAAAGPTVRSCSGQRPAARWRRTGAPRGQ